MLSRIPVHRFDALSLLTCRASIAQRPIINRYSAPTCSHRRLLSDSPAATAAAKERRWVLLNSYGHRRTDDSTFVADANTVAESVTSEGRHVRVSPRYATPPSSSCLYYEGDDHRIVSIAVIASHRELVLLELHHGSCVVDHFVYRPAGTHRPASLSLLPVPDFRPRLDSRSIGLLRRGENDLLAVQVELLNDYRAPWQTAEFCVLRPGMRQWELMGPVPILQDEGGKGHWKVMLGSPNDVICVGDRFLCWVCNGSSFLLCDMADETSPKVRYVRLPPEVSDCSYGDDYPVRVQRMGAAGDSSVRLVSIHPDCCRSVDPDPYLYIDDHDCCCRERREACWHPRFVFTVKTWTMNLCMDQPLEWVEDGEMDGEEIWALPGYEGLPQAIPKWPVVCLDKHNVVCFLVSNYHFTKDDEKVWMVQLNISTKTLLSVVQVTTNDDGYWYDREKYYNIPVEIQ